MYHPSSDTIFRSHPHASQQSAVKPLSDHSHPSAVYGLLHLCLFLSVSQFLNLPYWYSHSYLFLPVPVPVYLYFSSDPINDRKNDSSYHKDKYENYCNNIRAFFHHLTTSYLLLLFAHSFTQYPFIHLLHLLYFSITFLSIYYHNAFNSEIQSQFLN